jgi:ribosomal protein S18 acetylase RimI-like enzyme
MEIRRAIKNDALALSTLNVDVQVIHANAVPQLFKQPSSESFALQFMLDRLDDPLNYFFIANLDGEDIGYIYARIIDRPENPFRHAWKYIYIDQISIKPAHQRMGFGGLLLEAVRKVAIEEGIDTIALDTWSFNQQSHSFFKKHGFVTFNQRMWRIG